ncbi:MAG: GNAT family N-acetyltransferase [Gemmatimonadales bacterium]|jgi:acetyl coenzyme A synthetase (ADP forming)-like protein
MSSASGAGPDATEHPTASATTRPVDIVLRDGSTLRVRQVRADDTDALRTFLAGLTPESLSRRFGGSLSGEALDRRARELAGAEGVDGAFALVATAGPEARVVGHAVYVPTRPEHAEVAFVVAEDTQGQGVATTLLGHLARAACQRGIAVFEASVRPANHAMLRVFQDSGFALRIRPEPDEIRLEFPTELTDAAAEAFERRDWTAAVSAVQTFLHPSSVAVIGASRRRGTISGEVFHNLLEFGFEGPALPVNPRADVVQSVLAYPDVESVPGPVELAVIVVPAELVLDVARACGRKGVRALVVISAGFGETGEQGRERQRELMQICRSTGMRLIGPNCMGILNTHPEVRLNATFAPVPPSTGRVGFMSQSGALGLAVMDYAGVLGLGLSSFVSVGNKADISGNDLIRYWEQDPDTDVILLYLESFGNPRKFSTIARRVAREKPIVVVKSGRSPAGQRASGSHTGALISASDVPVDALFRQTGVIRTDTLQQMFDVAALLTNQPPPRGRRVAILTNAGGPGILCADACQAEGLEVPVLDERTRTALAEVLASEASVANPVDMIASASAEQYREAIRILGADPNVDALIVIFIPPLVTKAADVARAVVDGVQALDGDKTVLSVFMQARGVPEELRGADVRIPSYAFPEDAAIALARAARWGAWQARPVAPPARFDDVHTDRAASVVAAALGRNGGWLEPDDVWTLLEAYGLPMLDQRRVDTAAETGPAAEALGGKVALKAIAPDLVHKTEAGAVRLGLGADAVVEAAREMERRLADAGHRPTGFLVQRMAEEGVEMIVGVAHDEQFGPIVACGAGGVLVELIKDVSVRLTPLSRHDAVEMVEGLRTRALLSGYRGSPARDEEALIEAILRIGALVEDLPQIRELDLNPILVHERGATIVDARVRVAPADPEPLPGARD